MLLQALGLGSWLSEHQGRGSLQYLELARLCLALVAGCKERGISKVSKVGVVYHLLWGILKSKILLYEP